MKKLKVMLFSALLAGAVLTGMTACSSGDGTLQNSNGPINPFGNIVSNTSPQTSVPPANTSVPTPNPNPTPTDSSSEIVGTWYMNLDLSSLDEATAEQYRQAFAGVSMSITFTADGSFSSVMTNSSTGQSQNSQGTWSMSGNNVNMTGSNGEQENYTYANGRLTGVESYILYFTKNAAGTTVVTPTPAPVPDTTPTLTDASAVIGTWNMNINYSMMDEATAAQYRQMFANVTMTMTFNSDGTVLSVANGNGQTNSMDGTWSMVGSTVTVTLSDGTSSSFSCQNGQLVGMDAESSMLYFTR